LISKTGTIVHASRQQSKGNRPGPTGSSLAEKAAPGFDTCQPLCFLYVHKLGDLDGSFREPSGDFWFFDEILKRAYVHIRAALELVSSGIEVCD
jgi:hypothetical protein